MFVYCWICLIITALPTIFNSLIPIKTTNPTLVKLNSSSEYTQLPITQFFNIKKGDSAIVNKYLCYAKYHDDLCCSCDPKCFIYKNCCIDKYWQPNDPVPLNQYLQKFTEKIHQYKSLTCEPVFTLAHHLNAETAEALMVATCDDNAKIEDKKACYQHKTKTSYEYNIPVLGSDSYLYINSFCARCNFIEEFQLINITANCKSSTLESNTSVSSIEIATTTTTATTTENYEKTKLVDQFSDCKYNIAESDIHGDRHIQSCTPSNYPHREKCQPSNKYFKLCHAYHSIVDGHANYHCFLCLYSEKNLSQQFDYKCADKGKKEVSDGNKWSFTLSFSSRTNVIITGPNKISHSQSYCAENEIYNVFTEDCEVYQCSNGYIRRDNKCIKQERKIIDPKQFTNVTFKKCLLKENPTLIWVMGINANISRLKEVLENRLEEVLENTSNFSKHYAFEKIFTDNNSSYYKSSNFHLEEDTLIVLESQLLNKSSDLWKIIDEVYITKNIPTITELYGIDIARTFSDERLCASVISHTNITSFCSLVLNNHKWHYTNVSQWILYEQFSHQHKVSTCQNFYLHSPCKLTPLTDGYTISENQTLAVKKVVFKVEEYTPLKTGMGICTDTYRNARENLYSWVEAVDNTQSIIGYVCTPLSIICCVIIIITYFYFTDLQTLPGLIIIGLSSSLIFTDILFLISTQAHTNFNSCKTVAILLHWGLLITQSWIVILCFDLLTKIGSLTKHTFTNKRSAFVKYCLFGLSIATVIVGVAVILNEDGVYEIGYGANEICFIYNLYPRIFFYIIPVGLSFIIAVLVLIKTVLKIKTKQSEIRKDLKDSKRKENNILRIALKLVLTLGLIEVIGFIQISKDNSSEGEEQFNAVFATLYTLFRSSRGIILFFINTKTDQKLKLFKSLYIKAEESIHSTSSNNRRNTAETEI